MIFNVREKIFFFDFSACFLAFPFLLNLLIQFLRGAILQELFRQLALNAGINDLAFQGGKVILVLALQGVDGVQKRENRIDLIRYSLLLFFRWNRD